MSARVDILLALLGALAEPQPQPMTVPSALLFATSMPEPSGIVFSPELGRYLVISDDTGDKQLGTNHAPWLFAMSRDGKLDSEPLPILGIDKLNDAESICAGPSGTYLLATSHSKNRKGHDKAARRRLLQLAPSGRALKVVGTLDLATAIAESGVVPEGALDIEAMAYREGALYLGLKAPQTAEGAAILLRIADIVPALGSGVLDAKKVARWQEVKLRVDGILGPVVQGISDMTFLSDGSLMLLANSPKHMPADGGGALYWLRPGSGPGATLVRRFPGLKPEGITVAPDGKSLVIVFDRDRQPPLWLSQALPDAGNAPKAQDLDKKVRLR